MDRTEQFEAAMGHDEQASDAAGDLSLAIDAAMDRRASETKVMTGVETEAHFRRWRDIDAATQASIAREVGLSVEQVRRFQLRRVGINA